MRTRTARSIYIVLLRLHPGGFRRSFTGEMLRIFDEASESYGAAWLLGDAALSLLRQRLLRGPEDAPAAAAPARFGLLEGSYPEIELPHLTAGKLSLALLLTLASLWVFPPGDPIKRHMRVNHSDSRFDLKTFEVRRELDRRS